MFFTLNVTKYKYKVYNLTIKLALVVFAFFLFACNNKKNERIIEPSFYYWKSIFTLNNFEKQHLDSLKVKTIYTKIFDVDWDDITNQPMPKAVIRFADSSFKDYTIIPTVFITNECIKKIDTLQIAVVTTKIMGLINEIIFSHSFKAIPEIQIDCDWTESTKLKYFLLLHHIKKLKQNATLSVTIRLHQIKFIAKTGVPPADRGLLMCYNMGNLKNLNTKNSILETKELKKYVSTLANYPLPLDVGLPLFNWKVLYRNNVYAGLIANLPTTLLSNSFTLKKDNRFVFLKDTLLTGYNFKKGDVLRDEQSDYNEIISAADEINKRLKNTQLRVALYHLDSLILKKYTLHELETIYNSLR